VHWTTRSQKQWAAVTTCRLETKAPPQEAPLTMILTIQGMCSRDWTPLMIRLLFPAATDVDGIRPHRLLASSPATKAVAASNNAFNMALMEKEPF